MKTVLKRIHNTQLVLKVWPLGFWVTLGGAQQSVLKVLEDRVPWTEPGLAMCKQSYLLYSFSSFQSGYEEDRAFPTAELPMHRAPPSHRHPTGLLHLNSSQKFLPTLPYSYPPAQWTLHMKMAAPFHGEPSDLIGESERQE